MKQDFIERVNREMAVDFPTADLPTREALAVDPHVEAHTWIGAAAGERLQVLVDQHHALGRRLLEAVAELQCPPGAALLGARGDLAREAGLVAFAREDAAGAGERVARGKICDGEIGRHLAVHALDEVRLHFIKLGR